MAHPEEVGRIDFGFMTVSDYDVIVGKHLYQIESSEEIPLNGTHIRMIDNDGIMGSSDFFPSYIIQVPETEQGMSRIAFLRQVEWIRRELKFGIQATLIDDPERLFQEIEIELAATLFYRNNKEMIDELLGDSGNWVDAII